MTQRGGSCVTINLVAERRAGKDLVNAGKRPPLRTVEHAVRVNHAARSAGEGWTGFFRFALTNTNPLPQRGTVCATGMWMNARSCGAVATYRETPRSPADARRRTRAGDGSRAGPGRYAGAEGSTEVRDGTQREPGPRRVDQVPCRKRMTDSDLPDQDDRKPPARSVALRTVPAQAQGVARQAARFVVRTVAAPHGL